MRSARVLFAAARCQTRHYAGATAAAEATTSATGWATAGENTARAEPMALPALGDGHICDFCGMHANTCDVCKAGGTRVTLEALRPSAAELLGLLPPPSR